MRHSSCRTSLDVFTRVVDQQKREASLKVVELMLPLEVRKLQHPSAHPQESAENRRFGKPLSMKGILVDLVGIEPTTSSMPWSSSNRKVQTVRYLRTGITGKNGPLGAICGQNAGKT